MVDGLNPAFVFFLLSIFSLNKVSIWLLGCEKGWGLQLQLCSPSNRELFPQIRGNSSHKYEGIILTNQIPSFSCSVQKKVFFTLYWNISWEYLVVLELLRVIRGWPIFYCKIAKISNMFYLIFRVGGVDHTIPSVGWVDFSTGFCPHLYEWLGDVELFKVSGT